MHLKKCPAIHSWSDFVSEAGHKPMRIRSAISGSMRAKRLFPVILLMAIGTVSRAGDAQPEAPSMSEPVRAMLTSILDADRMDALRQTLSAPDAWGSLGPHASGAPAELPVPPPEHEIELTIPDDAAGSGTADDPYLDVIGAFLERFTYPAVSIEAYKGVPAEGTVDAYMERLSYAPVVVRLPSGYYRETVRVLDSPHRHSDTMRVAVDVPPGIWLKGEDEGDVVIQPVIEPETSGILFNLNNLVLLERKPHGRHAISGQASHNYLVAGNLSIAEGPLRNNIGFSDGSHRNRFIGNVALGTGEAYSGGRTLTGISVSGHGTEVRHNFIVGHPRGIRVAGNPDEAPNRVTHNYAESIVTHIYRSRNYQAEHNTLKRSGRRLAASRFGSPLPSVTVESLRTDFGLFER